MKLKLGTSRKARHSDMVCGVGWIGTDIILSTADDHRFLMTNTATNDSQQILNMSESFYPTSLHIFPRTSNQSKGGQNDVFAVATTDGKINILSRSGKMEKAVDAHKGAALCARWNSDGTGLLTCGEDGFVKMWSRNGMLRSVLAQFATAVYCVSWDSTSSNVLYCNADTCYIKSLKMQVAPLKWKAHDGIILCCDWNPTAPLIVTGGEDLKFKVWDGYGQILFNSSVHDYPITSVSWNTDGSLFAVGSHNVLRLCDKSGWSHSLEKMNAGSVMALGWSPDGTQLAIGTATGLVYHAHIIDKRLTYDEFEIVQTQKTVVEVRDVSSEVSKETLETKERISRMSILYKYLIVVTSSHIYIFSSKNWNTPTMIEYTETVNIIVQCEKVFLVSDGLTITVFTYEGRKLINLTPPGNVMALLDERKIDLANDTLVVRDRADHKVLHFFDPNNGKSQGDGKLKHEQDIMELTVNQCGPLNDRNVAFRDHIGAVYIAMIKTFGVSARMVKIGSLVEQLVFNDVTNMLCGISEGKIAVWPLPNVAFLDRNLLQKTMIQKSIGNVGKFPQLANFAGNTITIRKSDGCLVPTGILPFYGTLITMASNSKWDQAIRLCRSIGNDSLWATLAGLAMIYKNMVAMEISYAALEDDEKVCLINEMKDKSDKETRQAMQVVLTGKLGEADVMLERNGHAFRALMMNVQMFKWKRALEIALKNKEWLEIVMGYREKYLKNCGQKETDPQFLKHMSEVEIDWVHIRELIEAEKANGNY
ncbi:CBN-CHE-2 protein [Caenorhabditis brenneri]|uniref:CBN-CHE-2 protein n=1 Tax=Caenorhabditis brenneri TaxID=135651 RepID=G0N7H4_CAEBE|nr:CBN-CHE-2 protein [Caenorhabditis brenneri]